MQMVTAPVTAFIQGVQPSLNTPGASAEFGAELLGLQQQLFVHWHRYKDGSIDWPALQQSYRPIRQAFEITL